jgi:hypothetical protein
VRKLALRVFDYSLDGIIGEEDTDFFDFCRKVPDDPAREDWERGFLGRAERAGPAGRRRAGMSARPRPLRWAGAVQGGGPRLRLR